MDVINSGIVGVVISAWNFKISFFIENWNFLNEIYLNLFEPIEAAMVLLSID
jgi:hypothetical protein